MNNRRIVIACLGLMTAALLVMPAMAGLSLDDLIGKIQDNQNKVQDMYADTVTTINSNFSAPGSTQSGPKEMVQKGKIWTKGKDKTKVEIDSPMKQVTISNGKMLAMINPATGQKYVQDISKIKGREQLGDQSNGVDLAKAKQYFDLSVRQDGNNYVITGKPKQANKFLARIEFYIDGGNWTTSKLLVYGPKDKLMSESKIEYQQVNGAMVPSKTTANIDSPAGKMKVSMQFNNIKVNQGINDNEFKI
ncbi:MAG TPA: outer-membrane lipoprotein carrier protein LolA [Candidatus Omnitrophota bacterium]|nr:outer-membrane lipoprotein carrier protein LolA [Candidatus Omnitrophota bacterium]